MQKSSNEKKVTIMDLVNASRSIMGELSGEDLNSLDTVTLHALSSGMDVTIMK
jgi:hypothetical protein